MKSTADSAKASALTRWNARTVWTGRRSRGANALLEDLSNLLANEPFSPEGGAADAVRRGLQKACERCANLTVVTNEVFSGGADYGKGTLQFLQELAALNRELAAEADLVAEAFCGLPNVLKGALP